MYLKILMSLSYLKIHYFRMSHLFRLIQMYRMSHLNHLNHLFLSYLMFLKSLNYHLNRMCLMSRLIQMNH